MGYTWDGMTKVSYEEAFKMFKNNEAVYLLHDDETEALVTDLKDIIEHNTYGGEYGYE